CPGPLRPLLVGDQGVQRMATRGLPSRRRSDRRAPRIPAVGWGMPSIRRRQGLALLAVVGLVAGGCHASSGAGQPVASSEPTVIPTPPAATSPPALESHTRMRVAYATRAKPFLSPIQPEN